jgi:hypothetical protein
MTFHGINFYHEGTRVVFLEEGQLLFRELRNFAVKSIPTLS